MEITAPDVRNVGTMVLELLLLLLKLTFILGIVSSVFFQVKVGGRSPAAATTSKEGSRHANYPIPTRGGSDNT